MSCPDCFKGAIREGETKGRVEEVYGLKTYISEPEGGNPKGIIVFVPDAFGWELKNNRLLADEYASLGGYRVYLPDFMDNGAAPLWMINTMAQATQPFAKKSWYDVALMPYHIFNVIYGIVPFLIKNHFGAALPRVQGFVEKLRAAPEGKLPVGMAGFCWGGPFVFKFATGLPGPDGKPLVDAFFTAHPSNLSVPGDFEGVKLPVALAVGDQDIQLSMKQVEQVKKIWGDMKDVDTEIQVYEKMGHGFSVRVDILREGQVEQSNKARDQAVAWFKKHLVN